MGHRVRERSSSPSLSASPETTIELSTTLNNDITRVMESPSRSLSPCPPGTKEDTESLSHYALPAAPSTADVAASINDVIVAMQDLVEQLEEVRGDEDKAEYLRPCMDQLCSLTAMASECLDDSNYPLCTAQLAMQQSMDFASAYHNQIKNDSSQAAANLYQKAVRVAKHLTPGSVLDARARATEKRHANKLVKQQEDERIKKELANSKAKAIEDRLRTLDERVKLGARFSDGRKKIAKLEAKLAELQSSNRRPAQKAIKCPDEPGMNRTALGRRNTVLKSGMFQQRMCKEQSRRKTNIEEAEASWKNAKLVAGAMKIRCSQAALADSATQPPLKMQNALKALEHDVEQRKIELDREERWLAHFERQLMPGK